MAAHASRPSATPPGPRIKASSVAVIGAGISGVCAAAHALRQGLSVTVFERSNVEGGVWHFDPEVSIDPSYPNELPSVGDYQVTLPGQHRYPTPPPERVHNTDAATNIDKSSLLNQKIKFAPPGPCYSGLKNNVPTSLMYSDLHAWPSDTEDYVSQLDIEGYIQNLAKSTHVHESIQFNTRVDGVSKLEDGKWEIRSVQIRDDHLVENTQIFDAIIVATGHYNMPRIPDIPGLKEWKDTNGDRIMHSKRYRHPKSFEGKTILVIGGGVSSMDICRELQGVAKQVYRSTREGKFDIPHSRLPDSTTHVAQVVEFSSDPGEVATSTSHIPGFVTLADGQVITEIDHVILATGYITSYPFLPFLHSDSKNNETAGHDLLVAREGDMTHNLHRDIFFIEDPSLAFVGAPYHVATFSLFDMQAQVVARVFAGVARLPDKAAMRAEWEARKQERGLGRTFHCLRAPGDELSYVDKLVRWVNEDAREFGAAPMQGHSDDWVKGYWEFKDKLKDLLGLDVVRS